VDLGTLQFRPPFVSTELTGKYLQKATLTFDTNNAPQFLCNSMMFGAKLFDQITKDNVGKAVAILSLMGHCSRRPTVKEEIPNGQAVISGGFTPTEAKKIVGELNSGALPVPITLLSTPDHRRYFGGIMQSMPESGPQFSGLF